MVITMSAWRTCSSASFLGRSPVRSTPASRIASITSGWTSSEGIVPAERTSTRPSPICRRKAAAICERPALWTHTKRTIGRASVIDELVAQAAHRDEVHGPVGVLLDLSTEALHVDVEGLRVAEVLRSPHIVDEELPGQEP